MFMSKSRKSKAGLLSALMGTTLTATMMFTANDAHAAAGFETNQSWIESLQQSNAKKIESVESALDHVFSQLPDEVFVYPTENYYYFTFPADGLIYAGNLRLAARDRDKGVIHFAAFQQANQANEAGEIMYKALTEADGVKVEKLEEFSYAVTHKEKRVVFKLNDVSAIEPPKEIIANGEKYLGLVHDESGLRFFLFYNEVHKIFSYVLDESGDVLDQFVALEEEGRTLIGQRTGFAVYDQHFLDRRILIGVHGLNSVVNNYYDGPADQLPENHIKDDNLRKAIVDSDPKMKDKLDGFGYLNTGEGRYLITPYIQYQTAEELAVFEECAGDTDVDEALYDARFFAGDE